MVQSATCTKREFPCLTGASVAACAERRGGPYRKAATLSARDVSGFWNAATNSLASIVADRMVSVRPCLNAAVDADSYVAAV